VDQNDSTMEIAYKLNSTNMKKLFFISAIILFASAASGQALISEKCNWKNVTLISGDEEFPENAVIVGSIVEDLGREVSSMDELTEKELKKIRKSAKMFKACTIRIDYKQEIVNKELNPSITEEHLAYYIVKYRES
jgi:hypothetical protein